MFLNCTTKKKLIYYGQRWPLTFYFFFLPLIAAPLHPYSPTPQQPRWHSPCAPAPLRAQPLRNQPLRAQPLRAYSPARLRPCSPADSEVCIQIIATYFLLNLNG
ncbi:hypothetical protein ACOSP7_006323 [Xanthoceras sorbifolium]